MTTAPRSASDLNRITSTIIQAALEVHRILGPGLLESAYLACLVLELTPTGLDCRQQYPLPLVYKGQLAGCGYRADLAVESCVIVEVKAADTIAPIGTRQLLTYLRLADYRVGLLLNFGQETMKAGIRRVVNGFPD